jgi:hypothetical protein
VHEKRHTEDRVKALWRDVANWQWDPKHTIVADPSLSSRPVTFRQRSQRACLNRLMNKANFPLAVTRKWPFGRPRTIPRAPSRYACSSVSPSGRSPEATSRSEWRSPRFRPLASQAFSFDILKLARARCRKGWGEREYQTHYHASQTRLLQDCIGGSQR